MPYGWNTGPIFGRCEGSFGRCCMMGYLYELKWNAVDGHAKGTAQFMTAASAAKGLSDYSFERLECDPDVMLEICAAGFDGEFEEIRE